MTPEQLAARIGARAGRDVRVRPDLTGAPYRWVATVDGAALPAEQIASDLTEVSARVCGRRLVMTLTDEHVSAALERAAEIEEIPPVGVPDGRPLTLTRDAARRTTYAAFASEVGSAAARWAVLRSADGAQIDCASGDLAGLTPSNPVFPVLLAVTRLTPDVPHGPHADSVAALTAEWPLVVADAQRTGRTRPVALHLEALAGAAWSWTEGHHSTASRSPGDGRPLELVESSVAEPFAAWTGERLARTSRIVLVAGLSVAGIDAPVRL